MSRGCMMGGNGRLRVMNWGDNGTVVSYGGCVMRGRSDVVGHWGCFVVNRCCVVGDWCLSMWDQSLSMSNSVVHGCCCMVGTERLEAHLLTISRVSGAILTMLMQVVVVGQAVFPIVLLGKGLVVAARVVAGVIVLGWGMDGLNLSLLMDSP